MHSLAVALGTCNVTAATTTTQQSQYRPSSNGVGKIYREVL